MALKIRLRKQGSNNRAFYRMVVTDSRSPRDGKYLEALGWYNPLAPTQELELSYKADRVQYWLNLGAQLSDNVEALIAKTTPSIVKELTEKKLQHKAKVAAKRKSAKAA